MALEEAEIFGLTEWYCIEDLEYVTVWQGLVQRAKE